MRPQNQCQQIVMRFVAFHRENPMVWALFKQFAHVAARDRERYSSDAILHRVRWEVDFETRDTDGSGLKINDHFSAYYSRMFKLAFPEQGHIFECRKLKSQERPPRTGGQFVMRFTAEDEAWIEDTLRRVLDEED